MIEIYLGKPRRGLTNPTTEVAMELAIREACHVLNERAKAYRREQIELLNDLVCDKCIEKEKKIIIQKQDAYKVEFCHLCGT